MWQACPICKGEGKIHKVKTNGTTINSLEQPCRVCNGKGIISELTGLPPVDHTVPYVPQMPTTPVNPNPLTPYYVGDPIPATYPITSGTKPIIHRGNTDNENWKM